jgi:hypothetical protein
MLWLKNGTKPPLSIQKVLLVVIAEIH